MSHTNQTTNYHMSQFVGTDKPAWLADYNNDMSTIDTQMKTNADAASAASTAANAAATAAATAQTNAQTAITNAATAQTTANQATATAAGIGTLSSLKTTAKTTAVAAINEVYDGLSKLNLTSITTTQAANFGNVTLFSDMSGSITVVTNPDGSVFKMYGNISFNKTSGTSSFTIQTAIRPDETITISPIGTYTEASGYSRAFSVTISTTGLATISVYGGDMTGMNALLWPCLYFAKDFNDEPIQ